MRNKIHKMFFQRSFLMLVGFALAFFGYMASAEATCSGLTLTYPTGGEAESATINVTFTRTNCTEDVQVKYAKLSDGPWATCNDVTSWSDGNTVSDPGVSSPLDTTSPLLIDGSDYCVRVSNAGAVVQSRSSAFIIDNTAPVLSTATTKDTNANGLIDRIDVTFTEAIGMNNTNPVANTNGWTITADGAEVMTVESANWNGNTLELTLTEQATVTTEDTPSVEYDNTAGNAYVDLAENEVVSDTIANATDGAAPAPLIAEIIDADGDGILDLVSIEFSEVLNAQINAGNSENAYFALSGTGFTGLTEGNVVTDGNQEGTSDASDLALVSYNFTTTSYKTDVDNLKIVFTTDASSMIEDASGNVAASFTLNDSSTPAIEDSAAPVFLSATATDNTTIQLQYTEEVIPSFATPADWAATGITSSAAMQNGTYDNIVDLTVDALNDTAFTAGDLALLINTDEDDKIEDSEGNKAADIVGQAITDSQTAVISSAQTGDVDEDGQIDNIEIVFSEDLDFSTFTNDDVNGFTASGYVIVEVCSVADCADADITDDVDADTIYLQLTESGDGDTGEQPEITYSGSTITDANAFAMSNISATTPDDGSDPVLLESETKDLDGDGQIDAIQVIFSEEIDDDTVVANDFTVVGHTPTFGDATLDCEGGNNRTADSDFVCLTIDETGVDTSATPNVSYTGDSPLDDDIQDLATLPNTIVDYGATVAIDGASPVITDATYTDQDADGEIDRVVLTFSENIDAVDAGTDGFDGIVIRRGSDTITYVAGDDSVANAGTLTLDFTGGTTTEGTAYLIDYADNATDYIVETGGTDDTGDEVATGSGVALATTDSADPVILSATFEDDDASGDLDRVLLEFSEPVDLADGVAGDSLDSITVNCGGAVTLDNGDYADSATTGATLLFTGNEVSGTDSSACTVTYDNSGDDAITETEGDNTEIAHAATALSYIDGADPVILTVTTLDADGDGSVDSADLTMSENMDFSSLTASGFTIGGNTVNSLEDGGDAEDDTTLKLVLTNDVNEVSGTEAKDVTFTNSGGTAVGSDENSITDLLTGDIAETDSAAPVITSVVYQNADTGTTDVDKIVVTYSENVTLNEWEDGDWVISAGSINDLTIAQETNGVVAGGNTIALTVDWADGITGESGTEPELQYVAANVTPNSVHDGNGNNAVDYSSTDMTDGASPVLLSADYQDTDSNGAIETLQTTWSENVTMSGSTAEDWTIVGGDITATFSSATNDASAGTTLDVTVTSDANETGAASAPTIAYDNDDANDSVVDGTGNVAGTNAAKTCTDAAKPVVVSVSASEDPANATDDTVLTVTLSEDVSGGTDPSIEIDQQGTTDLAPTVPDSGDGTTFTYSYDVQTHNGGTYADGVAYIGVSLAADSIPNTMTAVTTASQTYSFIIQTVEVDTGTVELSSNVPEVDDALTVTAVETINTGTIADARLILTNQSDASTCTIELGTGSTADGAFGGSTETIVASIDLSGATACNETGSVVNFIVAGTTYKASIIGQDSIAGNWETVDEQNSETFIVSADSDDSTAPSLSSITEESITQTGAVIQFKTDETGLGRVYYGETEGYGSITTWRTITATALADQQIDLLGLTCGTTYHYTIETKDNSLNTDYSADGTFATTACSVADSGSPVISTTVFSPDQTAFTETEISAGTFTITATDTYDDDDTLTVTVNGSSVLDDGDNDTGTYVYTLGVSDKTTGIHTLNIQVTDSAGNLTTKAVAYSVVADATDTTAPNATVSITDISTTTAKVIIAVDEVADYQIKVDDDNSFASAEFTQAYQATTATGSFVVDVTGLSAETLYYVQIILSDQASGAGNTRTLVYAFQTNEENAPILSNIVLSADATYPSTGATIIWNTQNDVDGVATATLNTTSNIVEYGTDMTLAYSGATTTGDGVSDHSVSLSGLSANTTYYYRVKSVANGKTSYSQIFSFTTARGNNGLYTDSRVLVKSYAKYDATNPWTNGWHFQFNLTADSLSEKYLRMKLDNWVSGSNTLAVSGNTKILVSSSGYADPSESTISGSGTSLVTTYDGGTTLDLSSVSDNNATAPGKQFVVDLFIKIPSGQAAGSYSSSYGIANQSADSSWASLD